MSTVPESTPASRWWLNVTPSTASRHSYNDIPTFAVATWGDGNWEATGTPHCPPRVFHSTEQSGKSTQPLSFMDVQKQEDFHEASRLVLGRSDSIFGASAAKPSSADWAAYMGTLFEAMGHPPTPDERIYEVAHRPAVGLKHVLGLRSLHYEGDGDNMTFTEMCDVLTKELNFDKARGSNVVHIRSDEILPNGEHLLVQVWPNWLDQKGLQDLADAMSRAPSWEEVRTKYRSSTVGAYESEAAGAQGDVDAARQAGLDVRPAEDQAGDENFSDAATLPGDLEH